MSKNLVNLLLLVASFAIYYLVLSPLYSGGGAIWAPEKSVTALRVLSMQYDDTISQAETLTKQAEDLRNQYNAIPDDAKDNMKIMVPEYIDPVRLVSEISTIANITGVSLDDTSYSESPPIVNSNKGAYTVSFSVKTSYEKFKELMHNYETSLRLITIKSVTFNVPDKQEGTINFQVKLEAYYVKK
ncbi:MAG: hypothetical protein EXS50_02590 [Candidatus Taylorbacteria bacterium]|nr:hypothetical protein [Candidatus Taylorbacteria bacterium]